MKTTRLCDKNALKVATVVSVVLHCLSLVLSLAHKVSSYVCYKNHTCVLQVGLLQQIISKGQCHHSTLRVFTSYYHPGRGVNCVPSLLPTCRRTSLSHDQKHEPLSFAHLPDPYVGRGSKLSHAVLSAFPGQPKCF